MDFVELILDPETESRLIEQKRVPGENNVGMVAWRLTLYTPEYPDGRDIIVIANDITYLIGSFGPREDKVYFFHFLGRVRVLTSFARCLVWRAKSQGN